ncbi:glycoside hydrolase family 1 protein [Hymenobacter cellulosilyticus]|uniref:glycoside hydrolase family 1 protein n=1 Tax=Hymenobacter cellulosilyticus TaxID=2932248 RepID=UPI0028805B11|nr:family 1 glycosylhydrolase [Hymenobacter cellulosilyticus]
MPERDAALPAAFFPPTTPAPFSRADFGPDFRWGVSAAAYQTEGAWNLDGKGPSIWDDFVRRPGKIRRRETADVACDFYHRWPQDLDLLQQLGIPDFRFSVAWSRVQPRGTGSVNAAGLDFYDRLVDGCLERGITPWLTLYHWDLPAELQRRGGWANRDVVGWFTDYAQHVAARLGDRVSNWMVLNEPMVFVGRGSCWACTPRAAAAWAGFWPRCTTQPWLRPKAAGRYGPRCQPEPRLAPPFPARI